MQQWREQIERDDQVGDFETQLCTHDKRIIWVLHNAKAIRNAEGKVCYYESAIEDITERKQVEQERQALLAREQAARAAAEAASRMKDEFLATLSHELRTPLNAILGWASLLRTRNFNADAAARALEIIERNAKAQTQMIEDLLDISRIIRGNLCLSFQPVNLIWVLNAAIDVMKPAATAKNISLELLLDTGIGITPEFLPYVFDYFRQADSSSKRSQGGLGLGLAIVRQLVEIHGGTVCAESQGDGLGATLTVKIPLVETGEAEKAGRAEKEKPLATDFLPLDGVRVLVVEDEIDTRELMKILLEECGAKVAAVSSAAQAKVALANLEPDEPDIMISDIAMPEEDGYQLMRQLRSQGKQMPAIALTAYARDSDVQIAIAAGFQHHLSKPIEPDALIALVAQLVGRK